MKSFLQLCQDVYREGGLSGSITTVHNQSGEALRVVEWVKSAYREILNSSNFEMNFLRKSSIVQLTAGQSVYTKEDLNVPTLAQWDINTMRVAVSSTMADETFLAKMRYPQFRDFWNFSSRRTIQSRPLNCTVTPETNLEIKPTPNADYYLAFEWVNEPPDLADDTDTPVLPSRWVNCIMWRALRHYGMFEAAPEVVTRADNGYRTIMVQMRLDQSFGIIAGGPIC